MRRGSSTPSSVAHGFDCLSASKPLLLSPKQLCPGIPNSGDKPTGQAHRRTQTPLISPGSDRLASRLLKRRWLAKPTLGNIFQAFPFANDLFNSLLAAAATPPSTKQPRLTATDSAASSSISPNRRGQIACHHAHTSYIHAGPARKATQQLGEIFGDYERFSTLQGSRHYANHHKPGPPLRPGRSSLAWRRFSERVFRCHFGGHTCRGTPHLFRDGPPASHRAAAR